MKRLKRFHGPTWTLSPSFSYQDLNNFCLIYVYLCVHIYIYIYISLMCQILLKKIERIFFLNYQFFFCGLKDKMKKAKKGKKKKSQKFQLK